jgi:hypothetical protein
LSVASILVKHARVFTPPVQHFTYVYGTYTGTLFINDSVQKFITMKLTTLGYRAAGREPLFPELEFFSTEPNPV